MEIRIRSTGEVVSEQEFRVANKDKSLPVVLGKPVLDYLGADPVLNGPYPQATRYQTVARDGVEQIGSNWFTSYRVIDMDEAAKDDVDARQAESVRAERNRKLVESDWTQVADAPVDRAAWAEYRQALREVTSQVGFPWEINWPEQPT